MQETATDFDPGPKKRALVSRAIRKLWRLAVDRPYRNMMWLYWRRPKGAFQPFNDTDENRYPRIVRFVQSELGAGSDVKILSFGCSTGGEVFSLREYFPRAAIKGTDINPGNIAARRRRLSRTADAAISFETASSTAAEPAAWYDAIFETILRVKIHNLREAPIFGPDNRLMRDVEYPDTVFRKKNQHGPGA